MGLRDRLRERQPPQATVALRIDTSQQAIDNERRLSLVEAEIRHAELTGDEAAVARLRPELDEVQAAVDAAFEFVVIKALPPADMEALIAGHPPTDEQQESGAAFNRHTFYPALLAACVESPETEEDWAEIITSGELVMGEFNTLVGVAMELNDRSPSVSLGKGSTPTRS